MQYHLLWICGKCCPGQNGGGTHPWVLATVSLHQGREVPMSWQCQHGTSLGKSKGWILGVRETSVDRAAFSGHGHYTSRSLRKTFPLWLAPLANVSCVSFASDGWPQAWPLLNLKTFLFQILYEHLRSKGSFPLQGRCCIYCWIKTWYQGCWSLVCLL